jgi:hypothetical protein
VLGGENPFRRLGFTQAAARLTSNLSSHYHDIHPGRTNNDYCRTKAKQCIQSEAIGMPNPDESSGLITQRTRFMFQPAAVERKIRPAGTREPENGFMPCR